MLRYFLVVAVFVICGVAVVGKSAYTMFVKDAFWIKVAEQFKRYNVPVQPIRGNILSADGKLLASSLPEYKLYIDMRAGGFSDTLITNHINEISANLHKVLPDKSQGYFKSLLLNGIKKKNRSKSFRNLLIYPYRASYLQLKELKKMPYFCLSPNVSGFHTESSNSRKRPFGSLAERTIGDVYKDASLGAKNGLELAFDSILRGQNGYKHRKKVKNKYIDVIDVKPINGKDLVTTIDIGMQDIVESVLRDKLKEIGAESGIAILMEVKTGDIKAMVNLGRVADSVYVEDRLRSLSDLMEPGSTFKTASIMVALDDGVISMDDQVDTGNGIVKMYRRDMKDHNWRRGGYGVIDLQHIIMYSSNIGVSKLIDDHYHNNPEKFIQGLKRIGILQDWDFPMKEYMSPKVKIPGTNAWDATTLAWLSIGYNSQLPTLNTLCFYNAIANGGALVKPRIVKAVATNGVEEEEFPVEVVNPQICSPETLKKVKFLLEKVVSEGLGGKAGNEKFSVSGKTGTAMVAENGRYGNKSFVSFAGYFPSERPMYSCIVAITKRGFASGGLMSGDVFGRVAEKIYAKHLCSDIKQAVDSNAVFVPDVLKGNMTAASVVLNDLGVKNNISNYTDGQSDFWATASSRSSEVVCSPVEIKKGLVPNVVGMGAKDAIYLMESAGLRVSIRGVGKVRRQSVPAGSKASAHRSVILELDS